MVRPVGKCVFVFAGGTSYDFASFGPPALSADALRELSKENRDRHIEEQQSFRKNKGPDFKSRLTAYLNVAGPNQRKVRNWVEDRYEFDPTDTGYPLRRVSVVHGRFVGATPFDGVIVQPENEPQSAAAGSGGGNN